jgi:hypothetical protein
MKVSRAVEVFELQYDSVTSVGVILEVRGDAAILYCLAGY